MIVSRSSEGIEITWAEADTRIVPLLSAEEVARFWPRRRDFGEISAFDGDDAAVEVFVEVVLTAMHRLYPTITDGEITENLLITEILPLWHALWADSLLNLFPAKGPVQ